MRGKDKNFLEWRNISVPSILKQFTIHKKRTLNNVPPSSKLFLSKLFGEENEGMKLVDIFREHYEKFRKLIDIDYADITVRLREPMDEQMR